MDAGRRPLARPTAAAQARAPAALPPGLRWRTRADRRLRALVVRGPRPAVHALGVRRRRDEPSYGHLEKFIQAEAATSVFKGLVTVWNSFRGLFRGALMHLR